MRKYIWFIVPVLSLVLFVVIMQGGLYYIGCRAESEAIPYHLEQLNNDIETGNWESAHRNLQLVEQEWHQAEPIIQYHAEMDDMNTIKSDIARLYGSIAAQDLGLSLAELGDLSEHWNKVNN